MAASAQSLTRRNLGRGYRPQATLPGQEEAAAEGQYQPYAAPTPYRPYDPNGGMADTSGYDFYNQSAASTPISAVQPSSVPFYGGSDIAQQFVNNRNLEQNVGDRFEGYFQGEGSRRAGLENAALLKSGQLQGQLEQTPGYTGQEAAAIMGDRGDGGNAYRDLLNVDYGSNQLTPEERASITGDPSAAGRAFDPNILNATNETAFNAGAGYIQNAQDRLGQSYDVQKDAFGNAIDPGKLGLSGGYQSASDAVLNTTGGRVWDAATDRNLDMSSEYGRQAGMSDQEVADTAALGGQAVGARSRSAIQDLERQAAASGNASPLAVAAARREFEDQSAVGMADATVGAQLAARDAQRRAATGVEGTRLASQQYKTGAQIGAGLNLGRLAQGAMDTREGLRLGAERDISNRNLGAASQLGQVSRDMATYGADRQLQNEENWANRASRAGEFNQTSAYGAAADAERAAAERAAMLGTNRQNINQANQGNQFNRGYQVNATLSGASADIANARRQGQQENRGYYAGQQQYQGGQQNQQQQNMLQNRQQTQTGRNQSTSGSADWELGNKNAPNWFTKNVLPAVQAVTNFGNMANARPKQQF